ANHRNLFRTWNGGGVGIAVDATETVKTRQGWEEFQVVAQPNGQIALRTWGGYYVTAENGGGARLLATSTDIGPDELFDLLPVRDPSGPTWAAPIPLTLALQASSGQYVCAEFGGGDEHVNANRPRIDVWERFELETHPDGRASLRTHNGHYLVAEGHGEGRLTALDP